MKLRLLTLATAFAFASAAMAQEPEAEAAAPETAQPAYEPAPAAEPAPASWSAPATSEASGDNSLFDATRGRSYNPVGNRAAASTIADNLAVPYLMHGKKLVYVEPTNSYAALAFGEGSTKFVAFDNSQGLGLATFGLATKTFGASVDYAFGKRWRFDSDEWNGGSADQTITNIAAGDLLQARFAMPMGAFDVAARVFWLTWQNETETETETNVGGGTTETETDQDFWEYGAEVAVSNDPSAKDIRWKATLLFARHSSDVLRKAGGTTTETNGMDAEVTLQPGFDIGMPVLKSANARVLVGVNGVLPLTVYDGADNKNTGVEDSRFTLGLVATPNILGELALGNCWRVFAGAAYAWDVLGVDHETFVTGKGTNAKETVSTTILTMQTNAAFVNGGARFQYENFAVEASVANNFFNNPLEGFNGTNFIANLGGFIYF